MFEKFDRVVAERLGLVVQTIRVAGRETQTQLGDRCAPRLTLRRLSLLERGLAKVRPVELGALRQALPALDALLRKSRPLVPGKPIYRTPSEAAR